MMILMLTNSDKEKNYHFRWLLDGSHKIKKEHRPLLMSIAKQLVYEDTEAQFLDHWNAFCQTPEAKDYENYTR